MQNLPKSKLTFEEEYYDLQNNLELRKYKFQYSKSDHTIDEFINAFIKPLLYSIGYSDETINEYFNQEY